MPSLGWEGVRRRLLFLKWAQWSQWGGWDPQGGDQQQSWSTRGKMPGLPESSAGPQGGPVPWSACIFGRDDRSWGLSLLHKLPEKIMSPVIYFHLKMRKTSTSSSSFLLVNIAQGWRFLRAELFKRSRAFESPGILSKCRFWCSRSGAMWDAAVVTSPQVTPMLLAHGPLVGGKLPLPAPALL